MSIQLFARGVGSGPAVLLLHGLFGAGSNLGALSRHLQRSYRVMALDLPGHGRSSWLADYSLASMAAAIGDWMTSESLSHAHLVGHSLGGKVAMQLALQDPGRVSSLVVADIAPVRYPPRHAAVFAGMNAVAAGDCHSRAEAQAVLAASITEPDVVQFLAASLRRAEEGVYRWRLDLAGLQRDYDALSEAPAPSQPYPGPALFIKGADSDYIQADHREPIEQRFPAAQLRVMADCGHWLHAQKPDLFNALVARAISAAIEQQANVAGS